MHTHTTQTKQVGVFPCRGWVAPCQRAPRSIKGLPLRCQTRRSGEAWLKVRQPSGLASALDGGRTWWAHFEFTRINIGPTILRKKIEDVREAGAISVNAAALHRTYLVSQTFASWNHVAQLLETT